MCNATTRLTWIDGVVSTVSCQFWSLSHDDGHTHSGPAKRENQQFAAAIISWDEPVPESCGPHEVVRRS